MADCQKLENDLSFENWLNQEKICQKVGNDSILMLKKMNQAL